MFLVLSAKIKTFFELLIFLLSFSSVLMNSSFTFRNFTFSSSFARSSSKGLRSATCGALCLVLKPYVFVGCVLVLLSFPCRKKQWTTKNTGLPTKNSYLKNLITKTNNFIQRMRWKAHFFLHGNDNSTRTQPTNTYGFKTRQSAPHVADLKPFEDDLAKLLENVKFRNVNDEFIKTLEKDKRKINSSKNVFIFADKTRNIYEMEAKSYDKLLTENVTKTYKHAENDTFQNIEKERKNIASSLNISNRIEPMNKAKAFISLKDHKPDFENHPKCRLINPAKSQLGKVSKAILDKINSIIRTQTQVNQWRNTSEAISWFKEIKDKHRKSFISFDVVDFYPSITEDLLDKAIAWAKQFTEISDNDIVIIKHARKSLLFHKNHTWSKRNSNSTFDVTMGSYDGAEICELVGLFILNSLQTLFGKDVGLYRDDGLAVLNTKSGRLGDKARQDLTRAFNDLGLNITTLTNQQSTNFLDVTFDLTNNSYKPYRKPDNEPLYINHSSNHPPHILRELPKSINKRINALSCDRQTFDQSAPTYSDALSKSNFNVQLEYEQQNNTRKRHNRQRNVLWYNPPYSKKRQDKFSAELFTTDRQALSS